MASQNNSRLFSESQEHTDKCHSGPRINYARGQVDENLRRIPGTSDHHRDNNMNTIVGGDEGGPTDQRTAGKKAWEPGKVNKEREKPPKETLIVHTSDKTSSSVGDVSHKLSIPAADSPVNKFDDSQTDVRTHDLSALVQNNIVGSARERYLYALENTGSCYSDVSATKCNHMRMENSRKRDIQKDISTKGNNCIFDKISRVDNSKDRSTSSLLSVKMQTTFQMKHATPKRLSLTLGAAEQAAASGVGDYMRSEQAPLQKCRSSVATDNLLSEQTVIQKCRSSMCVKPQLQRTAYCPSPDWHRSQLEASSSSEQLHTPNVKSLKSKFAGNRQQQTCKLTSESVSNCVWSQGSHVAGARVKMKTSSTIQRIQEQLLQKMEADEARCGVKSVEKCVHKTVSEQHQDTETNVHELGGKINVTCSDKLHKEEKPYRQWHRMSRVVTADSKFIISSTLPCHAASHTKQNNPAPERKTELSSTEETINDGKNKDTSDACETEGVTSDIDLLSIAQEEENIENSNFLGDVTNGRKITKDALSATEAGGRDGKTRLTEHDSESLSNNTTLQTAATDSTQNRSLLTSDSCSNTDNSTKTTHQQDMKSTTSANEPEIAASSANKSTASMSLLRHKSINLKTFYMSKNQSFSDLNETCMANARDRRTSSLSSNVVENLQPLNSVSGASQVTGPSFSEYKSGLLLKRPAKKVISGGPILRTAARSRNRCISPGLAHGSLNVLRSTECQNACCRESRHSSSNIPRYSSRQSREGLESLIPDPRNDSHRHREQRTSIHPRPAPESRARGIRHENPDCINRNWSSGCAVAADIQGRPDMTTKKPHKVFLADVACKLIQKVNKTNIRVPWNEPSKKYTEVKATQDYNGSLPGQLSFRKGQIIKQRSFITDPSCGMCYGYYRVGRLRKKKKGLFPINCVATDDQDTSDEVSVTSSAKSAT